MPKVTICDPELTVGMPPHITAGTGLDALAHCLEAYCAPGYHPMADGIAVEGMRLVKEYLPRAYRDGADIEARAHMMSAAAMGATAFQKGLGAIHALSHPVGALYDTHHGLTNAVFMPYVLAYNRPAIEAKIERLCRLSRARAELRGFPRLGARAARRARRAAHARGAEDRRRALRRDVRHGARGPDRRRQPGADRPGERAGRSTRTPWRARTGCGSSRSSQDAGSAAGPPCGEGGRSERQQRIGGVLAARASAMRAGTPRRTPPDPPRKGREEWTRWRRGSGSPGLARRPSSYGGDEAPRLSSRGARLASREADQGARGHESRAREEETAGSFGDGAGFRQ